MDNVKDNREKPINPRAKRIWERDFGDEESAEDYSGRPMCKNEYGNRKSESGWNLDHLCPKSKGGKTTVDNLICCNIKTNDEKADRFPVYHANEKRFELIKVRKHCYKIRGADHPNQK